MAARKKVSRIITTKAKKRPQRKKVQQKNTSTKKPVKRVAPGGVLLNLAPDLKARLEDLATRMGQSLDQLLIQAAIEFIETWEEHQRVIDALEEDNNRVQIVVGKD